MLDHSLAPARTVWCVLAGSMLPDWHWHFGHLVTWYGGMLVQRIFLPFCQRRQLESREVAPGRQAECSNFSLEPAPRRTARARAAP
jgi:hypothetical protein